MYNFVKFVTNPTSLNQFEQQPLHFAIRLGDFKLTNTLIQKGAEINALDVFGNSPLSLACIEKPNLSIVRLLIRYKADVNFERFDHLDLFLECVLHCRTEQQIEIIKILIQNGVNINKTDKLSNRNCMHIVATTGYVPLAVVLLEKGAILDIRDNFNYTPIELARNLQNINILKIFEDYLAPIKNLE